MSKSLLWIKGLETYYPTLAGTVKAVDDIDVAIGQGEFVGLVGESGCGKSTVALSIIRIIPRPGVIKNGEIIFEGKDLLNLKEDEMRRIRGAKISTVFQDPMTYLNPVLKVGKQIAETIAIHNENKVDAKEMAVQILKETDMPAPEKVAEYYPHQLSGGMRQRVLIAIAVSCNPLLLIADEPTSALDVTTQAQIIELIKRLKAKMNTSQLLITHDFGLVAELCDRVYVMYAGKVVESGDVFKIFESPAHPYTQGLLDCVFNVEELKKELRTIKGFVPSLVDPPRGCRFHPRCPKALSMCSEKEPKRTSLGPGHEVYCWLYGEKY